MTRVLRKLNIDAAPAMMGWDFSGILSPLFNIFTVGAISRDPSFVEWFVRFTRVPLYTSWLIKDLRHILINLLKRFNSGTLCLQPVIYWRNNKCYFLKIYYDFFKTAFSTKKSTKKFAVLSSQSHCSPLRSGFSAMQPLERFTHGALCTWWTVKGSKGTVVNWALPSLH